MRKKLEGEFVNLIDVNQNILHKICRLYTYDDASHQDLFQEMVIQLWKSYPSFNGESKFSTWMYRIALNTAITLYRAKKKKVEIIELEDSVLNIKYEEYDARKDEQLNHLYRVVRELNDVEKALVYLYLEDKCYEEISETLGISEVNARVKMNRVKNKLKVLINR